MATSKTGVANLPLHNGKAPRWLFSRMQKLSKQIVKLIVETESKEFFFDLISRPDWFQSLGCLLGFDWHSSGITTTVTGALKSLNELDLGIKVAGGKGKASKTIDEIKSLTDDLGLSDSKQARIVYASRMSAKVDSALVQDGFELYHHTIFFSDKQWAVVQQGMNTNLGYARRYHWYSDTIKFNFTVEPHSGIASNYHNKILDMTFIMNKPIQELSVDLVNDRFRNLMKSVDKAIKTIKSYHKYNNLKSKLMQASLDEFISSPSNVCELNQNDHSFLCFSMPKHHYISTFDITEKTRQALKKANEIQPKNYEELLNIKGIGKKAIRALALVSDLVFNQELHFRDPVKYSFAHGGKDGTPYPVDKKVYDKTIAVLEDVIKNLELGNDKKLKLLKKLGKKIN